MQDSYDKSEFHFLNKILVFKVFPIGKFSFNTRFALHLESDFKISLEISSKLTLKSLKIMVLRHQN